MFTAYRQTATTMYSQKDLSIQHVEPVSEPVRFPMPEPDMELIWDRVFRIRPRPSAAAQQQQQQIDLESVNVTISRMAWKYRTYTEFFPDNQMHVELLQNFLAVPLQFAVTAVQYANYTLALPLPEGKRTLLPPELLTRATGGRSIKRFVSRPWTVVVFVASGALVVSLSGVGFWWILSQPHPLPKPSGIAELDFVGRISDLQARRREGGRGGPGDQVQEPFADLVHDIGSRERYTAWQIIQALQERRLGLTPVEVDEEEEGGKTRVAPVLYLLSDEAALTATSSSPSFKGGSKSLGAGAIV
ncbi:hypothetical protein CTA2_8661 [Colletotrichum tanaceti]|nr:hypothetical protein CTA2_8661 [Colletotrichum tanaceti]